MAQRLCAWPLRGAGNGGLAEATVTQDVVFEITTDADANALYCCSANAVSSWSSAPLHAADRRQSGGGVVVDLRLEWQLDRREEDGQSFVAAAGGGGRVFIACAQGTLLVIDAVGGARLRAVRRAKAVFTRCCYAPGGPGGVPACAVVGTASGALVCFALPAVEPWRRHPYDLALRDPTVRRPATAAAAAAVARVGDDDSECPGVACAAAGLAAAAGGAAGGVVCARATEDGTLAVVDMGSGRVWAASRRHLGGVSGVAVSESGGGRDGAGQRVVTGGLDETLGVWEGFAWTRPDGEQGDGDGGCGGDGDGAGRWRTCGQLGIVDVVLPGARRVGVGGRATLGAGRGRRVDERGCRWRDTRERPRIKAC